MANQIKLTKEMIENLINEELNNLSEEELLEQGWLSGIKGAYKGVRDAAKAGAAKQQKEDFFKKYYTVVEKATKQLKAAAENMTGDAEEHGIEGGTTIPRLQKNLNDAHEMVDAIRRELHNVARGSFKWEKEQGGDIAKEKEKTQPGVFSRIGGAAGEFFKGTGYE